MEVKQGGIGYISYEWEGAPSGVIDAYAGGEALLGIDEAVRFLIVSRTVALLPAVMRSPFTPVRGHGLQ